GLALLGRSFHHLPAQHGLRMAANSVLNFLPLRRIDLLRSVVSDDLAHPTANFGAYQGCDVIRSDRLMKLRNSVVLDPKPDTYGRSQADAVLGNGVVGIRRRLQPKIIQKQFVPRRNDAQTLLFQLAGVEYGSAAEA